MNKYLRLSTSYLILAGAVSIGTADNAYAGDDSWKADLRQFKRDNPGINGHALNRMYRAQTDHRQKGNNRASYSIPVIPMNDTPRANPVSTTVSGKHQNRFIRHNFLNKTFQQLDSGQHVTTSNGVDLDLGSNLRNITLGGKLFQNNPSVTIVLDGSEKKLSAGSEVTAAEYVAAKQVLLNGSQSIVLDTDGKATGGSIDLMQITARNDRMRADDFRLPVNVTAYGDFGKQSSFQIRGDLINAGSLYALSSRHSVTKGTIGTDSITNESTGIITSSLPEDLALTLGSKHSEIDLTLRAERQLTNSGSITSSGNLSFDAPYIVNKGTMQSHTADVTFNAPETLVVDNINGTISALNAINIRSEQYNGAFNTFVGGGDLISREVNVNAGRGTADLQVKELTGVINERGYASHVAADTDVLSLGNILLKGDPSFQNQNGDIQIVGSINVQEALTIIAGGNITNTIPVTLTARSNASGFAITLIAGANITTSGTTGQIGPIPPNVAGQTVTITGGPSATGGNVILGTQPGVNDPVIVDTRPGGANTNGADVLIAAFDNAGANGQLNLSGTQINTGGKGTGNNGNVTLIAGGASGVDATIITGGINTSGGKGTGGDITIAGFRPQSSGGDITYNPDGSKATANSIEPSATSNAADVRLGGDLAAAGNINMTTGMDGSISLDDFNATTEGPNGIVNITTTGVGNIFSLQTSTITTNTLNMNVGTGSIGDTTSNIPIFAKASFVNAFGDPASTDILFVNFNSGMTVFDGAAFSINVATDGIIYHDPTAAPITANTLLIGSFNSSAGLSATHPLEVNANQLFVAGQGGNVFVHNSNAGLTTLTGGQDLQAQGTFSIVTDGDLTMTAGNEIKARDVVLLPSGDFVNFGGTISGSKSVSLTSNNAITNTTVQATIETPLLRVTSNAQDVGSMATRFQPTGSVGAIAAFAPNGDVFLQGSAQGSTGIGGGLASGTFDYVGTGSTTITGNITTLNNDLSIVINAPATLTVASNASLLSAEDLILQVNDPVSTKQKVSINSGASIETNAAPGFGDILISVGAPGVPTVGVPPSKGVSFAEAGGIIFWGIAGLRGKGNNFVLAKGADVVFNNPIRSNNISVGGGVTIVADPPIATGNVNLLTSE